MAGILEQVYARSPVWAQQIGIAAYGAMWKRRRFGKVFRQGVPEFKQRETLSDSRWRQYQTERLRMLLQAASDYVPHYQSQFGAAGITKRVLEAFCLTDLPSLPILEKDTIRRDPDSLFASNVPHVNLHTYRTSGTTGTPMDISFCLEMHQLWSAAYEVRCRQWAGLSNTMSRAMIGGRVVVPKAHSAPPFWRYNAAEKQLYMSAFHISPPNAHYYADALNQYKPEYLVGYASAHFFLARLLDELRIKVHSPKAVLTSSEKLTPEMREVIEQVYQCEVFDAYSGVEACCLASECEHHTMHTSPDVGIIELVDEDGMPVKEGDVGEIVATGLLNFAQPLIRYRTGDYAVMSNESCACGRHMPVLRELVGRIEDTVIGSDGRETVRFHGIFVGLQNVRQGQIVQDDYTKFRLRLVVMSAFNQHDREVIRGRFKERLGGVEITFEYVDTIERTNRGKYRAVVSHVKRTSSVGRG